MLGKAGESWRKGRLQALEFPNNDLCRLSGRGEPMHSGKWIREWIQISKA